MSKSLCVVDEIPAPLLPPPPSPHCWTSLAFLPSSKIYMFFVLFIEKNYTSDLSWLVSMP